MKRYHIWIELTSLGPHVLISPGSHVILMLTSSGPHVSNAWQEEEEDGADGAAEEEEVEAEEM